MIEIKNKNGDVIYAVDADTLRWANLHGADLSGADLSGADLRWANLHGADLSGADLSGANLHGANLRWANLHGADLSGANLHGANLRWANLHGANLRWANLHGADLSGADLSGADLRAKQYVCQINGSRHTIVAIDDDVRIGCERQTLAEWLETFESVGKNNGYSPAEIAEYGIYLRAIAAVLEARK